MKSLIIDGYDQLGLKSYSTIIENISINIKYPKNKDGEFPWFEPGEFNRLIGQIRSLHEGKEIELAAQYVAGIIYGIRNLIPEKYVDLAFKRKLIAWAYGYDNVPVNSPYYIPGIREPRWSGGNIKYHTATTGESSSSSVSSSSGDPNEFTSQQAVKLIEEAAQDALASILQKSKDIDSETTQIANEQRAKIRQMAIEAVESAKEGFEADEILRQAFTLWEEKETSHRRNFKYGIFTFVGLIALSAIGLWAFWDTFRTAVGEAANASVAKDSVTIATAQMLSRIVLLSLPFATMLWVLRAVLRWANLNLSLAEDAAQRAVLAQTYVNLLAHGAIEQDKDREIMLSALFRPLPGIKDIDVPPMSIRDYLEGSNKLKK